MARSICETTSYAETTSYTERTDFFPNLILRAFATDRYQILIVDGSRPASHELAAVRIVFFHLVYSNHAAFDNFLAAQ